MNIKIKPIAGARWSIGRQAINGEFIGLIQNTPIDCEDNISIVLYTLNLPSSKEVINYYFPKNKDGLHCPTFELMSLWYELSPASVADATQRV